MGQTVGTKGKGSKTTSARREVFSRQSDPPQSSPDLFEAGGLTKVSPSLPIWEASNILTQRKQLPWKTDPDGKLIYSRDVNDGDGVICFRVADNTEEENPSTLAGAAALAVIDTFDTRAACMHLIFAAYASQMERSWEQELVISDRQIEAYLGLQKRTDKNRQEKLALIEEIVKQPCKITTFISWPGEAKRKKFTVEEGRLWHLLGTRYHYQQNLFGEKQVTGMSFVVKAGLWAKYFLNEEDMKESTLSSSKGVLSQALLESVMSLWQHRAGAARLMVWLLFKAQLSRLFSIPVRTLMEVAYGAQRVEDAKGDNQLRKKLTNTWDEDLLALHDRGWQIHFDDASYPADIQPSGFGRSHNRRPRGFFNQLLEAHLEIRLPENWALAQLEDVQARAADKSDSVQLSITRLTGTEIKTMRKAKGWSQRKLARITGISQGLISMMENGDRSVTDANEALLKQTLEYM
ncbi:Helix-turn-helix domain protein [Synechococcus sp. PCC 7335]|uniref:helix-turn-helix domain-containing protein n=1 Tax=Synechococcus sp. (strain ATCC 29403 / PCC 7335) TaxID=91464 RepID=UPI00017ECF2D|nr:helix-turn-helix transcriptional regulator [Synechococcus sp. PCC 7335]EDX82644.1 Helix-turn-helix domain protein [Synechococcus sp. PCC 7335]